MKNSIKTIFKNLSTLLLISSLTAGVSLLLVIERNTSFSKINILNKQKTIALDLMQYSKSNSEIALIQFEGKTTQLHINVDKLREIYKYDITGNYIIGNFDDYMNDLNRLDDLIDIFKAKAKEYFSEKKTKSSKSTKEDKQRKNLQVAFYNINKHIDSIIFKNISYNELKFNMFEKLAALMFMIILITTYWYRKRLERIYQDIQYLNTINITKNYKVFSQEIHNASLKLKSAPANSENSSMIDSTTGINNQKGLINSYTKKKSMKPNNHLSLAILNIDDFSELTAIHTEEFIQSLLQKVTYNISLFEEPTDTIARTGTNQFTIIFSRENKEQLFKDVDTIRQNISEIKLENGIQISVSGAFVIKSNTGHLNESLKKAEKIIDSTKNSGKNKIYQSTDLVHEDL